MAGQEDVDENKVQNARGKKIGHKHKQIYLLMWGSLVIFVTAASVILVLYLLPEPVVTEGLKLDSDAQSGAMADGVNQMPNQTDGATFRIVANQVPVFKDGMCNILVSNPDTNGYDTVVSLMLEGDEKVLGSTERLSPGEEQDTLELKDTKDLKTGSQPAVLVFRLYEPGRDVVSGEITTKVTLHVTQKEP